MRGLTLVEILVSLGIASIVGVLLLVIIVNSAGLYTKESSKVEQGLNINDALSQIRSTIKQASGVAAAYTDGSTIYTTGTTQLILKIASIDSSSNIIDNTFDYFIFFLDQKMLRFRVIPDALSSRKPMDQIFSTNIDSLKFQYFNSEIPPTEVSPVSASKIRITLTLKQRAGATTETNTATSEANLRND